MLTGCLHGPAARTPPLKNNSQQGARRGKSREERCQVNPDERRTRRPKEWS